MRKKLYLAASLAFAAALSAGVAGASINAQADAMPSLAITATSVRTADPSGLRFQTVLSGMTQADLGNYPNAVAYTTLTFEATDGETYTTNVPATAWRPEGDLGWNTVLLDIPASDYVTEVTAQSFIYDGTTKLLESTAETTSIAKTAAKAIAIGKATEAEVGH